MILDLQVVDNLSDSLGVLVSVDVFGHLLPLLLHVGKHFLLVLNIRYRLLQFFLKFFDLVALVLVLNTLVTNLLLSFKNLLFNGFFVFFPLVAEIRELVVHLSDFGLEYTQVLPSQLFNFFEDFALLFEFAFVLLQIGGEINLDLL